MAEYIERKRLEEAFDNADPDVCESYPDGYSDWGFGRKNVREVISSVPAADVAPVVQGRETREGGSTMNISEAIDRAVKAKWRADLINMLADAGRTLEHANLRANGNVYQDINVGLLLLEAARSLQECQSELEPENPDDVVVKVTVPDRWPMTEAGQRRAAQEAAASKPMTNRLATMTDAKREIAEMLAADVVPVVHGKWIIGTGDDEFDVKCPKCGWDDIFEVAGIAAVKRISETMHYCPNCGARMWA